jgi:phytoene dehydrogenase-like protein
METKTDVVVVGAGAAGLAAAKTLAAEGVACVVIEAMGRIGGRAHTSSSEFGVPFDVGCAWLHAADRNPFFPEAQAAGWTLQHHAMGLDHLYFGDRRADRRRDARPVRGRGRPPGGDRDARRPDDRLASLARACHLEDAVSPSTAPWTSARTTTRSPSPTSAAPRTSTPTTSPARATAPSSPAGAATSPSCSAAPRAASAGTDPAWRSRPTAARSRRAPSSSPYRPASSPSTASASPRSSPRAMRRRCSTSRWGCSRRCRSG